MTTKRPLRCAIYTRKSTEEGLDQSFNSLDAQREACAAYIKSQTNEGWSLVPAKYDDGGFSGGNLERPALQRLLTDIDRSKVDCVVVYKIDRLTRSLADFAKIVERFDQRNVTFVSVTQSFNTTTSMGRLTLNVLLSFAQFEREVTAERIRDKFAASRAKGIFMGGNPPLGYDARDRKLIVNPVEAKVVRMIFQRYLDLGSAGKLLEELEAKGTRTKAYVSTRGRAIGGGRWYIGPLRHVLRNPVYAGLAQHKGKLYPGQHEAIIDKVTFDTVQARLTASAQGWERKRTVEASALLTGLIVDSNGNRMSPQWSLGAGGNRHCYYVSQAVLQRRRDAAGSLPRVAAPLIDQLVLQCVGALVPSPRGNSSTESERRSQVRAVVQLVVVKHEEVSIQTTHVQPTAASKAALPTGTVVTGAAQGVRLTIPGTLRRWGGHKRVEGWNKDDWTSATPRFDKMLLTALGRAHRWRELVESGSVVSIDELADRERIGRRRLRELIRLAYLGPDVQKAIVEGRQPQGLSLERLSKLGPPASWAKQRRALGLE
ncbi:MAG: recombinase family protein [Alphaproteobacteria bacterium]|nr:recombinase family protein [Alphaproteobacteria bacterium]